MSKKGKKQHLPKPLSFRFDCMEPWTLRLANGNKIKQGIHGVPIYVSRRGNVYTLTKYGLLPRKVRHHKKRNYGRKSRNGVPNGPRYPYVIFRGKSYPVHLLVVLAWIGPREEGYEIDHITGNIDDCRLVNLRLVTKEENRRCAKILKRLRKAARDLNDPSLDPKNRTPQDMLKIYETLTVCDPQDIMLYEMTHHMEI